MRTHDDLNKIREYIIEQCYKCYVKNGVDSTKIEDFCLSGNLNISMLYRHFLDKEDILLECVNFGYMKFEEVMCEALERATTIEDVLDNIKDGWAAFSPERQFLCQAISSPSYKGNRHDLLAKAKAIYERFVKRFSQRFGCSYEMNCSYINTIFILMSYYTQGGFVDKASLQCRSIFPL